MIRYLIIIFCLLSIAVFYAFGSGEAPASPELRGATRMSSEPFADAAGDPGLVAYQATQVAAAMDADWIPELTYYDYGPGIVSAMTWTHGSFATRMAIPV